jgi:hypothetical protein
MKSVYSTSNHPGAKNGKLACRPDVTELEWKRR